MQQIALHARTLDARFLQRLLGSLAQGGVAHRYTDQRLRRVLCMHPGQRDVHGQRAPFGVLHPELQQGVFGPALARGRCRLGLHLAHCIAGRGEQKFQRHAAQVGSAIAEHVDQVVVDGQDAAIGAHHDHAIRGELQQSSVVGVGIHGAVRLRKLAQGLLNCRATVVPAAPLCSSSEAASASRATFWAM